MGQFTAPAETVLEQLHWRYATKKFDPTRKIPADLWQTLEQSLVLAPSSFGLQPWKFFVVENPELRQQLVEHAWGQPQVLDASHLVIFTIKRDIDTADVDRYIARMSEVQHTPVDALQGFANMIKGYLAQPPYPLDINEWSKRQLYIALGQFMTCAAMLGIDTCPMEGFVPAKYDEILNLNNTGYQSVVLCPAGYRAADDQTATRPKVRYAAEDVVAHVK